MNKNALLAKIKQLEDELLVANCASRCRVCDTDECGTMYCRACYYKALEGRDLRVIGHIPNATRIEHIPSGRVYNVGEKDGVPFANEAKWLQRTPPNWSLKGNSVPMDDLLPSLFALADTEAVG